MIRAFLSIAALVALATPALAYDTTWDGDASGVITINLSIDGYIQILWQDQTIEFDGSNDYYAQQLAKVAYASCPDPEGKFAPEAWAGDGYYAPNGMYYEAGDGGVIYVKSNCQLSMRVETNGDLAAGESTIPTWFTVALAPFQIAGQHLNGSVPFSNGHYLYDASGGVFAHANDGNGLGGFDNWPNQFAFPCDPAAQAWVLGPMSPYVEGTIKFLARILRHGMADPAGDYTTTLDVLFTSP